jgi:hypothetical protein
LFVCLFVCLGLLFAHRLRSILGAAGRINDTVTSEPVDGNGAQNMANVQSGFRTKDLSITGPTRFSPALTGPYQLEIGGEEGDVVEEGHL